MKKALIYIFSVIMLVSFGACNPDNTAKAGIKKFDVLQEAVVTTRDDDKAGTYPAASFEMNGDLKITFSGNYQRVFLRLNDTLDFTKCTGWEIDVETPGSLSYELWTGDLDTKINDWWISDSHRYAAYGPRTLTPLRLFNTLPLDTQKDVWVTSYYDESAGGDKFASVRPGELSDIKYISIGSNEEDIFGQGGTYTVTIRKCAIVGNYSVVKRKTDTSSVKTSTGSILDKSATNLLTSVADFWQFESLVMGCVNESHIIPGLEVTNLGAGEEVCNEMVPQGTCVAGEYLLVSAYCATKKHESVIYVLDKNSGKYLTTIVLKGEKCRVGALAWNGRGIYDGGMVYVADSDEDDYKVWKINLTEIDSKVRDGQDSSELTLRNSFSVGDTKPGFLTYYAGKIYVGQFDKSNLNDSYMVSYTEAGKKLVMEKIMLPLGTQGVSFVEWKGETYLLASVSYGRDKASAMKMYHVKPFSGKYICGFGTEKTVPFPNMSEDITILGDRLYTCFESAATYYRKGLDGKGNSAYPIDRLMACSVSKLLSSLEMNKFATTSEEETTRLASGGCGANLDYTLYKDGSLYLSGSGAMEDYSQKDIPWKSHITEIKKIYIGADVTSIGANAFKDAIALESVTVSEFSDTSQTFTIGAGAFSGCKLLTTVTLPNKDYSIDSTAVPTENSKLVIQSDAESVAQFCKSVNVQNHAHHFQFVASIAPTANAAGYDEYRCSCGGTELRNVKDATGIYPATDKKISAPKKVKSFKLKNKKKKKVVASWKKVAGANGYQIQYAKNKKLKNKKAKLVKKQKVTITKLQKKKTYYFRVRAYKLDGKKKVYGKWSAVKKVKVKK